MQFYPEDFYLKALLVRDKLEKGYDTQMIFKDLIKLQEENKYLKQRCDELRSLSFN